MAFLRILTDGVDDLVMCSSPSNGEITKQLGARYDRELIYTNIGDVLIAVNPYKRLPIYGDEHIKMYLNSTIGNTPPHPFQLAESAYRSLVGDGSSQAVIISGESGAGKTESAKIVLNYVSAVSGDNADAKRVKEIIHSTNPLLESFGNAKTVRNDNSSRFGKYLEVVFTDNGDPKGGQITNFLLEKTRVAWQAKGERNFHIFYQLVVGAPATLKKELALEGGHSAFQYLSKSGCTTIEGVDDAQEFQDVVQAMKTVELSDQEQYWVWQILAGILHVGNIQFSEGNPAKIQNRASLETAAYLLELDPGQLEHSLTHRTITSGSARHTVMAVPQNPDQAAGIRDALAKTLYERVFDWLIVRINRAMNRKSNGNSNGFGGESQPATNVYSSAPPPKPSPGGGRGVAPPVPGNGGGGRGRGMPAPPVPGNGGGRGAPPSLPGRGPPPAMGRGGGGPPPMLKSNNNNNGGGQMVASKADFSHGSQSIGVLDIYGFEIFQTNAFEQFCINYVNERLQQVFIDLTLRQEQKEYQDEGMKWKDIKYFDNKVVCDLIEGTNPPGLFRLLDDTCKTLSSLDSSTVDSKYMEKVNKTLAGNEFLVLHGKDNLFNQFTIKHYAGDVTYDVNEFCFKNYDSLYTSLVLCMQSSNNKFFNSLFPEDVTNEKQTPTTSGTKIRQSAGSLMQKLGHCTPHYIRCIKPNTKKAPMTFVSDLVEHQVKYLGLLENVRVKRAGYAYRHHFNIFLRRFGPLMDQPTMNIDAQGCQEFVNWVTAKYKDISPDEFGIGKTKIFVKSPDTIWLLEEKLEQKTDPEGYKLKVKAFKENEARAKKAQGSVGLKPKCLIM